MKFVKDGNILIINFDENEEIIELTAKLINKLNIKSGIIINASGELKEVVVFRYGSNENEKIEYSISEDLIITSASGYIAMFGKSADISLSLTLAKNDHLVIGGYINKAIVKNNASLFILVPQKTFFEKRFDVKNERFKLGMVGYEFR